MKRKTMDAFIQEHRAELDEAIKANLTRYDKPGFNRTLAPLNDDSRRCWVLNEEALYAWAKSEGVRI